MGLASVGVVIGTYNMPNIIQLQIAAIRRHCGEIPIVVSDDCSDGFCATPNSTTPYGQLIEIVSRENAVYLWPNTSRIGHAGGDMSAFWKAIIWGKMVGLDFVFKLSHRFVIDTPQWAQGGAQTLLASGLSTLGRSCTYHHWHIRTEAVGMRVDRWHRPDILCHLTPRRISWPTEMVIWDDIRDRLEGTLCEWALMSPARPVAKSGVYFREANSPQQYRELALRLGMANFVIDCTDSPQMANYLMG
jgi:hypothetical protein